jgi:hypothetical protein
MPVLPCLFAGRFFVFRQRFNAVLEQPALLQQAAEIFFAGVAMFAFAAVQILQNFVSDFQSFEMNDADVFVAMFPNLALSEFQRHVDLRKTVSPKIKRGETVEL